MSPAEVEEVFFNRPVVRKVREGRLAAYGRTDEGRYLAVIFCLRPGGGVRVITARDMNRWERRYYRQRRRNYTHNSLDYLESDEPVEIEVDPALAAKVRKVRNKSVTKRVTLRLRLSQIEAAKEIARKKDIPYQTLLRSWIAEGIRREQEA
ncbi:MAG: BrnT family toxin [Moorellales bacterium]